MTVIVRRLLPALLIAVAAAGCNQDPGADNGTAVGVPAACPGCPMPTAGYPAGPYALTPGSTIAGFSFQGFADGTAQSTTLDTISIADFYNPNAGDPTKPTALLIDIASVWCGPCNEEAKSLLNGLYSKYKPCGGEFLFQLAEGAAPGAPVTQTLLHNWVSSYKVAYPATLDPTRQLYPLYSSDSFPDGAIVDTRTMKIVEVISGVPDAAFWSAYESLLDKTRAGCTVN